MENAIRIKDYELTEKELYFIIEFLREAIPILNTDDERSFVNVCYQTFYKGGENHNGYSDIAEGIFEKIKLRNFYDFWEQKKIQKENQEFVIFNKEGDYDYSDLARLASENNQMLYEIGFHAFNDGKHSISKVGIFRCNNIDDAVKKSNEVFFEAHEQALWNNPVENLVNLNFLDQEPKEKIVSEKREIYEDVDHYFVEELDPITGNKTGNGFNMQLKVIKKRLDIRKVEIEKRYVKVDVIEGINVNG